MSKTKIFARSVEAGRQLLVYGRSLELDEELAMVLPIPVPPKSPEDAVRFIDLSTCSTFLDDDDNLFPAVIGRSKGLRGPEQQRRSSKGS